MSENLSLGPVQLFDNSVDAINLALRGLQDLLDEAKGLRGRVMVYDRIRADDPTETDDVVTLGAMNTDMASSFVTVTAESVLPNERVLTGESTVLTITDDGANTTVTVSVTANGITFAKMQQIATDRLLGRDTAATGNIEALTVGNGLEFTGSGGIQANLASIAETNTGTDATVSVTADGLAGSTYGTAVVGILASDPNGADLTTGDVKAYWRCPDIYNGWDLVGVAAHVTTVSSSGAITVQVRNITQAADMLSTAITIDQSELDSLTAATPAVIDTSNDDVATGDAIAIDVDGAGAGTKGLFVELQLRLP